MSPQGVSDFLDESLFGVLGTTGRNGVPHLVTMAYLRRGDAIVVGSFATAQKVVNARRTGMASFLVEISYPYDQIRGVLVTGRVTFDDDPVAVARMAHEVKARQDALDGGSTPDLDIDRHAHKRLLMSVAMDHVVSWDHRRLDGVY
jgi:nitroimidazol reductase NimA-like FMN-containing flavoprotein (pyridoxamine 5'-phosphate oxidase superfamily)